MDKKPFLRIVEGSRTGERHAVTADGLRIGRDPACDIPIGDPGVSREHARVFLHNGAVWAQDAGSRNGVFVNGTRLARPKSIGPGDRISVGDHVLLVVLEEAAAPRADDAAPDGPTALVPGPATPAIGRRAAALGALIAVGVIAALVATLLLRAG
jgi:S-DNA-T family DNA segregation ATPase FtsK/SpoIIIE